MFIEPASVYFRYFLGFRGKRLYVENRRSIDEIEIRNAKSSALDAVSSGYSESDRIRSARPSSSEDTRAYALGERRIAA
nr:hypothetical protein [Natrinema gelatinilyticum]